MNVTGTITKIKETQTFGASGFRKRELILTTADQYPQPLLIEFVQDKTELLDKFKIGDSVDVSINLRGREWIDPKGEAVYFNSIQGWKIDAVLDTANDGAAAANNLNNATKQPDDLPF